MFYATSLDCQILILKCSTIVTRGYIGVFHSNAAVENFCIDEIICMIDTTTKTKTKPQFCIKHGQSAIVRLVTKNAVCVDTYKRCSKLGRFILRSLDWTIGFGKILRVNN